MTRKLVNLKDNNDILVPEVLGGFDVNNVLASYSAYLGTFNYVALEDCYMTIWQRENGRYAGNPKIDNVSLYTSSDQNAIDQTIFLKKGQTYTHQGYSNVDGLYIKVFGIKY